MAHIGCPITGDGIYGKENKNIGRHALHAACLEFPDINGRTVSLSSELPDDMKALIESCGINGV